MIDVTWLKDGRNRDPKNYLIPWNDNRSRQRAFLAGWQRYLNDGAYKKDALHWYTTGAYFASVLGDIPTVQWRQLYYASLAEFLKSRRCAHWIDEQRREALRLARQAPGLAAG